MQGVVCSQFSCCLSAFIVSTPHQNFVCGLRVVQLQLQEGYGFGSGLHLITELLHNRQRKHDVIHQVGVRHLPERMNLYNNTRPHPPRLTTLAMRHLVQLTFDTLTKTGKFRRKRRKRQSCDRTIKYMPVINQIYTVTQKHCVVSRNIQLCPFIIFKPLNPFIVLQTCT